MSGVRNHCCGPGCKRCLCGRPETRKQRVHVMQASWKWRHISRDVQGGVATFFKASCLFVKPNIFTLRKEHKAQCSQTLCRISWQIIRRPVCVWAFDSIWHKLFTGERFKRFWERKTYWIFILYSLSPRGLNEDLEINTPLSGLWRVTLQGWRISGGSLSRTISTGVYAHNHMLKADHTWVEFRKKNFLSKILHHYWAAATADFCLANEFE